MSEVTAQVIPHMVKVLCDTCGERTKWQITDSRSRQQHHCKKCGNTTLSDYADGQIVYVEADND